MALKQTRLQFTHATIPFYRDLERFFRVWGRQDQLEWREGADKRNKNIETERGDKASEVRQR